MKVHINELKTGSKKGYKVRWAAEGKPKEKFRKNYDEAAIKAALAEQYGVPIDFLTLEVTNGN
jgi:hypothetical protein